MTEAEVRALLEAKGIRWESFERWIQRQTVGLDADGAYLYYPWDVQRFVSIVD